MARINLVTNESANAEQKALLDAIQSQLGMVPNFLKVFANSPEALRLSSACMASPTPVRSSRRPASASPWHWRSRIPASTASPRIPRSGARQA